MYIDDVYKKHKDLRRPRKHKVLFDRDFNFRGKRHDDKHEYKRKPKNNRWDDEAGY